MCGHSSSPALARGVKRPTRAASRNVAHMPPLFGLAPGGVYRAAPVARDAVRSCRTLSTLPVRRRAVCFLWHYPSPPKERPGVTRHRCSVEPGLSSPPAFAGAAAARPSGRANIGGSARSCESRAGVRFGWSADNTEPAGRRSRLITAWPERCRSHR